MPSRRCWASAFDRRIPKKARLVAARWRWQSSGVLDSRSPFVLLDDARPSGASGARLYHDPVATIIVRNREGVRPALSELAAVGDRGLHAAGFLAYEAGFALEPKLSRMAPEPRPDEPPLLWFGLFEDFRQIAPEAMASELPPAAGAGAAPPYPLLSTDAYGAAFAAVRRHIADGDVYQVNLTFPAEVRFWGDPLSLYALLRRRAGVGWGGIVHTGNHWLLSCSPELFFTLSKGRLTARPMKGTAPRHSDPDLDAAAAAALGEDEKQRAENLMIVDLLRNDLSRVAVTGSVAVEDIFMVETYPTVHQMTSTVTARLEPGRDIADVLTAMFPCGSVTGAPKIRAMELIAMLEAAPRQVYTGSIGRVAPDGDAAFNVAIRTLVIRSGEDRARLGLGSGVVADSRVGEEWRECLAKGAFVSEGTSQFDLIETMAFDPHEGMPNLERHLNRMKASAELLGFPFDRHHARNELQAATFRSRDPRKVRLLLSRSGALTIESRPLAAPPTGQVPVAVHPLPVASSDFRLRHKTSDRGLFEDQLRRAGTFEVLFVDEDGFLTQGSFTTPFVNRGGILLTPPAARAIIPGVLRDQLLADGRACETDLRVEDLADGFLIGNALRGLISARLVA